MQTSEDRADDPLRSLEPHMGNTAVAPAHGIAAIAWLEMYAKELDISYDELMHAAEDWLKNDRYLTDGGKFESVRTPDEFWDHYERVKGVTIPDSTRGNFFSCQC